MSPTIALARELIRRPSVTPDDGGCQGLLAARLTAAGLRCESLPFGEVSNLWARRGSSGPLLAFVGHTDVVPTGPLERWRHPPFEARLENGLLHGRGAADMKGSVAAFVTACERFAAAHPGHPGSMALLLTSDEEGPAVDGTVRVVETLQARGERVDYCLVGEPSSEERLGDTVKVGRRGSLHGHLTVQGVQGHVAYPHRARNPVHAFAPALAELVASRWCEGNEHFPATTLQVSNVAAGTGAYNVIPGGLQVDFNFRFSSAVTEAELRRRVEALLERHGLEYEVRWELSAQPFLTEAGRLLEATVASVEAVTGQPPQLSTAGGTSDGRFLAPTGSQVVELGPINRTIHQIDECVSCRDLDALSAIYEGILGRVLGTED